MPRPAIGLIRRVPHSTGPVSALTTLAVLTGLLAVGQAVTLAWLITTVVTGADWRQPAMVMGALVIARGLLAGGGEVAAAWAGQRLAATLRTGALRRWLTTGGQTPEPSGAVAMAGEGAAAVEPYVARLIPAVVTAVVIPPLTLVVLVLIDPWSAVIVALTLPLLPFFAALIGAHTQQETQRRWHALTALSGHFLDVVRGLPTLVTYGRAERQVEVIGEVGERHRRATVATLKTAFLSTAALELLATISVALVAVAVGLRLAEGWMGLQAGLTAILLAPEAYWPIRRVGAEYHNAVDGQEALAELVPGSEGGSGAQGLETATDREDPNSITLRGRYRHPGSQTGVGLARPIDVTVETGPGLTVITGASGSGKSTLLDLLAGLRRSPDFFVSRPEGSRLHYARQRPLLVPGTVRDNLLIAAPRADDQAARLALQNAGLWGAMQAREGLDTALGDDGFGLSAGQRARLSLARAMLSPASIVVLDEPVAHVDQASRQLLHEGIRALAADRRVIAVSHDPSLAQAADQQLRLQADDDLGPAAPAPAAPPPKALPEELPDAEADTSAAAPTPPTSRSHQRRRLALACLLGGLSAVCGVALTATSGWLIVRAWQQPVLLTLLVAIVGVRAFGIGRPVFRYAERVVSHDLVLGELVERRRRFFRALIPLTPARLGRRDRGDLLTAAVRDLDDVVTARARVTVPLTGVVMATALAVVLLTWALPTAGLTVGVGAGLVLAIGWVQQRLENSARSREVAARARVRSHATRMAAQLDDHRALLSDVSLTRALAPLQAAHQHEAAAARWSATVRGTGLALTWLVAGGTAVAVSGVAATSGGATMSAPMVALVALTPWALIDLWTQIPTNVSYRAQASAAQARLDSLLAQSPAVVDPGLPQTQDAQVLGRSCPVSLHQVSARWSPAPASPHPTTGNRTTRDVTADDLTAMDLTAMAGSPVWLTGRNGSGKSTALAVLARHLDPLAGWYHQGRGDVQTMSLRDSRSRVALVDDDPHVFTGTVRANLQLAAPDATDAELERALDVAGLAIWHAGLPDGLDSQLAGLSGGERTRLELARAVASRRPVLLLDEPTAHLDHATAQRVMADLTPLARERTVVMVSHDGDDDEGAGWRRIDLDQRGWGSASVSVSSGLREGTSDRYAEVGVGSRGGAEGE